MGIPMKAWLVSLSVLVLAAQDPPKAGDADAAAKLVSAERMKKLLTYLASDELEGRHAGYAGNDKATEFIAQHFKSIGLTPCGDRDGSGAATYWQAFEFGPKRKEGRLKTRNCVAVVEGCDERLKAEVVILGAHHDHVGKADDATNAGRMRNKKADPDDTIWNGADDNGSGTATLLEVARAFMEGRIRTKRTVLFMTFSAEEYGLLGSAHYTRAPIFPLDRTVAMINMDMVGRNPEKKLDVGGVGTSDDWAGLVESAASGLDLKVGTSAIVSPGSDHFSFASRQIPSVHLFTGFHEGYHCQSDHVEKIAFDRMEKIGRFALKLVVAVADAEKGPAWKAPPGMGPARPAGRVLGITGDDLSDDEVKELKLEAGQGGVRLGSVVPGGVAEKAGMAEGDVILEINGVKLPREGALDLLRREIREAPADADVPVTVLRGGERKVLKVRWPKA